MYNRSIGKIYSPQIERNVQTNRRDANGKGSWQRSAVFPEGRRLLYGRPDYGFVGRVWAAGADGLRRDADDGLPGGVLPRDGPRPARPADHPLDRQPVGRVAGGGGKGAGLHRGGGADRRTTLPPGGHHLRRHPAPV